MVTTSSFKRRSVLPERSRFHHRLGRCHLSSVRRPCGPGDRHVLPRQHHLRHHLGSFLQERQTALRRLRRLQLQCLGFPEAGESRHGFCFFWDCCVVGMAFVLFFDWSDMIATWNDELVWIGFLQPLPSVGNQNFHSSYRPCDQK